MNSDQTNRYSLVGLRQHGDEHVNENDHHAAAVSSKHKFSNKLGEMVRFVDSEDFDRRQTVDGKVQRLNDLKQAIQYNTATSYM